MHNGFDEWGGYMEAKVTKLEEQFSAASDPFKKSDLFQGISIFVNGLTNPSADELKRIMMVHGGTYHHYERSHTTYIIASNLPDVKVRNMNTSKIISPQWVVDCLKEQKILDYTRYILYSNQKTSQPRISFVKKKKEDVDVSIAPPVVCNVNAVQQLSSLKADLQDFNEKMRQSMLPLVSLGEPFSSTKDTTLNVTRNTSGVARTAVDPKFLSEFFNNSRLHHIATLGAGFKQYISELREQGIDKGFPARLLLKAKLMESNVPVVNEPFLAGTQKSCVMHIDMDSFFVSVGLRKNPHLRGHPVAVTHSKGGASASAVPVHPNADRQVEMELFAKRFEQQLHNNILSDKVRGGFENKMSLSEIASASYEARAKGIHNGMFVGQALKLCPDLKTIQYDFEGYREVAFTLYNTIAQYTLNIEAVSCDEMFVDLTDLLQELQVEPMDFVKAIREEVREKTQCPCSAGVGANKLQARMATKKAKPDGQYYVQCENVESYMSDIPIKELPGVGSSTDYTLRDAQLVTCGDLQKLSLARIQMLVGKKFGETLYQFCRGIDQRGLSYGQIRKSVSAEVNYGIRFKVYAELETFLKQLCVEVHNRLINIKRRTKCITLKLMIRAAEAPVETSKFMGHGVCDYITKSVSVPEFTNDLEIITRHILTTMKALNLPPNELRGIGIQLTKLDDPTAEVVKPKENIIKNMFSKVKEKQKEKVMETNTSNPNAQSATDVIETVETFQENEKRKENLIANMFSKVIEKQSKDSAHDNNVVQALQTKSAEIKKSPENRKIAVAKRGRPKSSSIARDVKGKTNILGMLQSAANKQPHKNDVSLFEIPSDIDPEVFNALPLDIREEILKERRLQENRKSVLSAPKNGKLDSKVLNNVSVLNESDLMPSTSRAAQEKQVKKQQIKSKSTNISLPSNQQPMDVDPEFLAALPPDLRIEIEQQLKQQKQMPELEQSYRQLTPPPLSSTNKERSCPATSNCISSDNIFTQSNCIELLLAWLQSSDIPENYDVDLMCKNACELVRAKELYGLYEALLYLGRVINQQKSTSTKDCPWHLAFRLILDSVQKEMAQVYGGGRKLYMAVKLKCNICKI